MSPWQYSASISFLGYDWLDQIILPADRSHWKREITPHVITEFWAHSRGRRPNRATVTVIGDDLQPFQRELVRPPRKPHFIVNGRTTIKGRRADPYRQIRVRIRRSDTP